MRQSMQLQAGEGMKSRNAQKVFARLVRKAITKKDLRDFAHIVIRERKVGMESGLDKDGRSMKKLRSKTVKRKKGKSVSPSIPLIGQGHLKTASIKSVDDETAIIIPAKRRRRILAYHEDGSGNLPQRSTWGIFPEARRKIAREFRKRMLQFFRQNTK